MEWLQSSDSAAKFTETILFKCCTNSSSLAKLNNLSTCIFCRWLNELSMVDSVWQKFLAEWLNMSVDFDPFKICLASDPMLFTFV